MTSTNKSKELILIGSGGHAKVLLNLLIENGENVIGYVDVKRNDSFPLPYLGTDEIILAKKAPQVSLINGVGSLPVKPNLRKILFENFKSRGFTFGTVISKFSIISKDVVISEGAQIIHGAIIQPGSKIGANSIINTGSKIDHDCEIADHVHISPGAILCGGIKVGTEAHIGAGAVIIQNIEIGEKAIVGAGTTIIKNVMPGMTAVGASSRLL